LPGHRKAISPLGDTWCQQTAQYSAESNPSMNPYYIVSNIAKNAVVGLMGDALISHGKRGLDKRPEVILETLQRMGDMIGPEVVDLNGELVYELGPGRTPYIMNAMALTGASQVIGLDVFNWMKRNYQQSEFLNKIVAIVTGHEAESFRQAFGISKESLQRNLQRFNSESPIGYKIFSGDCIQESDNSIGFLYSKSVLEHVTRNRVEAAIRDQYRALKPGALSLHIIDLRDHLHISGDHEVRGDWLDALRYPEWLHNALTSNRRAYINRLRANAWREVFANQGFEIVEWHVRHNALPEQFDPAKLASEFRSTNEDFSISWVDVLLRKPD